MAIFKRGRVYWFHFLFNGEHVQQSTKQRNRKAARDIEAAYRTALAKGEVGIVERKPIPKFKAVMQSFLNWSKTQHAAHPGTYSRYQTSGVALLRHFKDMPLDKITAEEVEKFKTSRLEEFVTVRGKEKGVRKKTDRKISPATVNREIACLRAMFNHAIKGNDTLKNPICKTGAKTLPEDNEQMRVLDFNEQAKYLSAGTPMLRDVATLILETGMRPEEVYRIVPENVHLKEAYLYNPHGKTKAAKRSVPLNSEAISVLARVMDGLKTPYLFPCETDAQRPVPKVNNAHDRAVKASGVEHFRLYDLRHTWATRAAQSGMDLVTLAKLLGHTRIQMVMRYVHPTQDHQTQAVAQMEQYVLAQKLAALLPQSEMEKRMIQ